MNTITNEQNRVVAGFGQFRIAKKKNETSTLRAVIITINRRCPSSVADNNGGGRPCRFWWLTRGELWYFDRPV